MNCKKDSTYCDVHGKPYPSSILALMRNAERTKCFMCIASDETKLPTDYTLPTAEPMYVQGPTPTPIHPPTTTPLPLITSEQFKEDIVPFAVPSNPLQPNFAPGLDELWHNLANGVPPLFGVPGIDVYVKRIADSIPNVIKTANYVLVNYSAYVITGGSSPTIPMIPYFPSANPFATVYQ